MLNHVAAGFHEQFYHLRRVIGLVIGGVHLSHLQVAEEPLELELVIHILKTAVALEYAQLILKVVYVIIETGQGHEGIGPAGETSYYLLVLLNGLLGIVASQIAHGQQTAVPVVVGVQTDGPLHEGACQRSVFGDYGPVAHGEVELCQMIAGGGRNAVIVQAL